MSTPKPSTVAWLLGGVYALLFLVGAYFVFNRCPAPWARRVPAEWAAARALAPPEQLDSTDLVPPGDTARLALPDRARLVGLHLVKRRRKGAPVSTADLAPLSLGEPKPRRVRFALTARAGEVAVLELVRPGEQVTPCTGAAPVAGAPLQWSCDDAPFTVVALHRPVRAADSLWAVLEAADAVRAASFAGAASRLLVRR